MGSDWVPMGSDWVRCGPMGSDWVISHTHNDAEHSVNTKSNITLNLTLTHFMGGP